MRGGTGHQHTLFAQFNCVGDSLSNPSGSMMAMMDASQKRALDAELILA